VSPEPEQRSACNEPARELQEKVSKGLNATQSAIQVSPWFREYLASQKKPGESYEDFLHRVMFGGNKK